MGWVIASVLLVIAANVIANKADKKKKTERKRRENRVQRYEERLKKTEPSDPVTKEISQEIPRTNNVKAFDKNDRKGFYSFLNRKPETKKNETPERKKTKVEEWLSQGRKVYRGKSHLMTPTERQFYHYLQEKFGEDKRIFAQVRVLDVVNVNWSVIKKGSLDEKKAFRQISQWHVDYVVTDQKFKIICAAELDDASHQEPERERRDAIINEVFRCSEIKLYRFRLEENDKRLIETSESV